MRSKSVAPTPRTGPRALLGSEILSAVLAVALILVLMFSGTRVGGDTPALSVAAQQRKSLMGGATSGQQQQQQQLALEEDPNAVTSESTSPISVSWFPEIMMPAGVGPPPQQEEKRQLPSLPGGQASDLLPLVPAAKPAPAVAATAKEGAVPASAPAAAVVAPLPSSPAAAATPPLPAFALSTIPLGAFFDAGGKKGDLADRLGQCIVLGAGRPVGSALVALLHSQGVPVRAVDDGRKGFVSTVPFEVVLDEVDVRQEGVLKAMLLLGGSESNSGLDSVFVDMDPATPIEPFGVPLACLLAHPHTLLMGSGSWTGYKRVVFAASDASISDGASASLESILAECGSAAAVTAAAAAAAAAVASSSANPAAAQPPKTSPPPPSPSMALLTWPGVVITGVGVDVERKGAGEDPLSKALKCLADEADALPYDTHEFVLENILKSFFRAVSPPFEPDSAAAAPPPPAPAAAGAAPAPAPATTPAPAKACLPLIPAAASHALSFGLHSANAAGDAVHAAYTLAGDGGGGGGGAPPSLSIFTRASSDFGGDGLVPHPSVTDGKVLRNNLPSLSTFAPHDRLTAFTTHLLSKLTPNGGGGGGGNAGDALSGVKPPPPAAAAAAAAAAAGGSPEGGKNASVTPSTPTTTTPAAAATPPYLPFLLDALWWPWRQGLVHGYRDPEPHPVYDPSMVVAGVRAGAYTIHSLATYGVSHASGHTKMRYAATTWGWRFKRGGIPWSSTKGDEVVAVKVIEPRQGSPYHLLALRTMAVWDWAVTVYPRHTWYIRMWDDVFPVVERYLDIANSHDGSGKLAVGRVIGKRQAYLSGGPPGLFSAGWADILRARYGAPDPDAPAQTAPAAGEVAGAGGSGGSSGVSSTGAETCLHLFEAWKGDSVELPVLRGRGVRSQNELLSRRAVETHCDLGCEDLVIEWCMRDVLGGYYELVHWWGLDALAPSTINDKGLYECKAMACRRRVIARGDPNDNNPIQMVVFHYVKPWEMVKAEAELYGGPPAGSTEWVDMCEAAQARGDCGEEVIFMPLPEPWTHGPA